MRNNYTVKRFGYEFEVSINQNEIQVVANTFLDPKEGNNLKPHKFKAVAKCHPSDKFSTSKGTNLCIYRIMQQMYGVETEIRKRGERCLNNYYAYVFKNLENKLRPDSLLKEGEVK